MEIKGVLSVLSFICGAILMSVLYDVTIAREGIAVTNQLGTITPMAVKLFFFLLTGGVVLLLILKKEK